MNRGPLTVQNAEIHTAAVEIKTLTVKGKQVTLAVYRQIQWETILDDEGAYRGIPWGTVNYHPGDCSLFDHDHRHVVWQMGSELRRDRLVGPHIPSNLAPGSCYHCRRACPPGRWHEILSLPQLFIAV